MTSLRIFPLVLAPSVLAAAMNSADAIQARLRATAIRPAPAAAPEAPSPTFIVPAPDGIFNGMAPVVTGIPFAPGQMLDATGWHVETAAGVTVPAQVMPAAWWPDGSVRVAHVALVASVRPGGGDTFRLAPGAPAPVSGGVSVSETDLRLSVSTGAAAYEFDKRVFRVNDRDFRLAARGATYTAVPFSSPASEGPLGAVPPWQVEVLGPVMTIVKVEGDFRRSDGRLFDRLVRFRARLTFWRGIDRVRVELTFRQNQSYNFNNGPHPPPVSIDGLSFGNVALLPDGPHAFGAGTEKTFDLDVQGGSASIAAVDWDPDRAFPSPAPRPIGFADPAYVESTGAFGLIVAPLAGVPGEQGEALERFERLQRAKVRAEDVERLACDASPTAVAHLAADRGSWRDYGDLRWAGDCQDGPFSRNIYDWVAALYMHALRTRRVEFANAAQIMARHEIDLDIYHTWENGPWFNFMKNWETGNHNGPDNCFGAGRPSHTWNRGYLLHYLLTGERRGLDAVRETAEGARGYLYETNGPPIRDREIRIAGWLTQVLVTRYLLDPRTPFETPNGPVSPLEAVATAAEGIVQLEEGDGARGYVLGEEGGDGLSPLQILYAMQGLFDAYELVLRHSGHPMEGRLRATMERMARFLIGASFGGETRGGKYLPLQLNYWYDLGRPGRADGQVAWMLMAADAAGWLWLRTGDSAALDYARRAFRDFVFYRETGGNTPVDPGTRAPAAYGSCFYVGTEAKIHGWSGRFGQWYLAAEREARRGLAPARR